MPYKLLVLFILASLLGCAANSQTKKLDEFFKAEGFAPPAKIKLVSTEEINKYFDAKKKFIELKENGQKKIVGELKANGKREKLPEHKNIFCRRDKDGAIARAVFLFNKNLLLTDSREMFEASTRTKK